MNKADMEKKLAELTSKQAEIMKQKKANRNLDALKTVRDEMNELKKQVHALNRA